MASGSPDRHDGAGDGSRASTYAQLALGMATFGSATPVSKIVTGAMPVFVASAVRVALGSLLLAPLALRRRAEIRRLGRREWLLVGLIALFGMFGFSALMLYGMRSISGVSGAIVMSTAPAVTAAASMAFFDDPPTWRKLSAVGLAVAGVLVLQLGGGGDPGAEGQGARSWLGIGLVFGAVCCEAAYTLLGKKLSETADPLLAAFLGSALALPLFAPLAVWQAGAFDVSEVDARAWWALAWYGAGTLGLGSWLWYAGVARAPGSVAAVFMGVMPASALVLSYVLLDEAFAWLHLMGFAVVFSGVLLVSWEHARTSH